MSVSLVFRYIVRSMHENGVLSADLSLLQIGEPIWSGPWDPNELLSDANRFVSDPDRRAAIAKRINELAARRDADVRIEAARTFLDLFFSPRYVQTIDVDGGPDVLRHDLNQPLVLDRRFDVVVHHGAAAHVFDPAQVFRTIHDWTLPRGLMIHQVPFTGGIDRGFYNFQPTLFSDLALANGYDVLGMFIVDPVGCKFSQVKTREAVYEFARAKKIAANALLFAALRTDVVERPFRVPMQGYYGGALSEDGNKAWRTLR